MKYYPACNDKISVEAATAQHPKTALLSYHYFKNKKTLIGELLKEEVDIFIDSGAFSAMSLGKEVNIDEYCEFIHETGVSFYAVLDVIGDAQKTYDNLIYMQRVHGLSPIPVFHMGSTQEDLLKIVDYDYIALGGLVMSSNILNHCDKCWEIILKKNDSLKVHAFGVTNIDIMKKYPWSSVDSSSYTGCRRFGRQMLIDYNYRFRTISEDEFLDYLQEIFKYDKEELLINHKKRRYLEDFMAISAMKTYTGFLTEINKTRDFSYLSNQLTLFD